VIAPDDDGEPGRLPASARVDPNARICPFCGDPPGAGVFCDACGRNLGAVERLPTRAEWERDRARPAPIELEERCSEATAAFLAAMRAAGCPGTTSTPTDKRSAFRKPPELRGWVLRPVDREDFEQPRRYEPGLVLSVDGRFHRLDSELRGWGQRDFPTYRHTVSSEPVEMPADERLLADLARVLDASGLNPRAP
jgi:hypothetical protein